ncbi:DUF1684 domain-containing protein [Lutimonas halocynthiae]|uniref:DUF1684 domain-containing protein n=1 Tax=Lutimonas halocynthiae TaxID=1446477 RepID=UPI0025B3CD14|nr:DUF1684 domain-containing protein [Lutimonas halocynthiae]MDN3642164.1 DUF1684 domain-containing protein [Lutimonas halocynthiae]
MKIQILVLALLFATVFYGQETKDIKSAKKFQQKLNKEFSSKEESPLKEEDLANFESLDFFPIDSSFIVNATLTLHKDSEPFPMKTTTDRLPIYKIYATANFEIKGKAYSLEIYQNEKLVLTTEYEDYLFLPFTDKTNGNGSYGGGRYLDLKLPEGDSIIIDFNQAYNPYCAYNDKYSCPVPPKGNNLDIEVLAGVKSFKH